MIILFAWINPASSAAPFTEIRMGFFPNITHAQALYAKNKRSFENATKMQIKWTSFNAGPTAVEALFTDAIDLTFIGPSPTINGYVRSRGEKFVIIAGAASGGAALVIRGDAAIHSEKDFGGMTIATPQLGNTQDIAAREWFSEHHYKLTEKGGNLNLIALSNADQLTTMKKKQIDGAWTIEPWVSRLEVQLGARVFLEEKDLWPEGHYVTTQLVVRKAFLADHPELIRNLLRTHVQITRKINDDKPAAAIVLNDQLKKETGKELSKEVITKSMARVEFTWDPYPETLKKSAEAAHKVGFLRKQPEIDGIYALEALNEVLQQMSLPSLE
ncbi:MAG: transporter, substrate-binding protein, partial [Verrucomicrobiales bacterium]|nr:transporter, substrate-binding protein [Verrucomicrobiales bacterium]